MQSLNDFFFVQNKRRCKYYLIVNYLPPTIAKTLIFWTWSVVNLSCIQLWTYFDYRIDKMTIKVKLNPSQ